MRRESFNRGAQATIAIVYVDLDLCIAQSITLKRGRGTIFKGCNAALRILT